MAGEKGNIEALMDFSLSEYLTPRMMKLLYALHLLVGLVVAIGAVLSSFRASTAEGLLMLILAAIGLFFWILYVRVVLELIVVVFRMGADLARIAESAGR